MEDYTYAVHSYTDWLWMEGEASELEEE